MHETSVNAKNELCISESLGFCFRICLRGSKAKVLCEAQKAELLLQWGIFDARHRDLAFESSSND